MNLFTLDFETYFDQEYSLRRLTTEEYVRDRRFQVHCAGTRRLDGEVTCSDGSELIDQLNWDNTAVLCHHAQFDGLILSHHYGIRPAFWFDTLSMARYALPRLKSHSLDALATYFGLPNKTVPYDKFKGKRDLDPGLLRELEEGCKHDVELTYAVFQKLLPHVPKEELRVIDLTVRMFTEPALVLDQPRLEKELQKIRTEKEAALSALGVTKASLQSSAAFAALLRQCGVEPPTKPSPSNPETTIYALAKTDEGMKGLMEHANTRVAALAAARLGEKSTIGETRAERLLSMHSRGALLVYLKYWGAHTGRWSGGDDVNWQNFPRNSEIRKSILAPPGYVLCVIDLAQIELRVLSWWAREEETLAAMRSGQDFYVRAAQDFYGRDEITPEERRLFKVVILGSGYGMGADKFHQVLKQQGIDVPLETARVLNRFYRVNHARTVNLWRLGDIAVGNLTRGNCDYAWGPVRICGHKAELPNGAALDYSGLRHDGKEFWFCTPRGEKRMYGARMVENLVQASARIILSQAVLKIAARYKIVMSTHDEVVYLARKEDADAALTFGMGVMKTPPAWAPGLPLDAEGGYNVRYSK